MEYIALAIAPGIAICLFIFYRDIYNREPRLNLIISFILGGLAILPAIVIQKQFIPIPDREISTLAILAYLVVALSEEASKLVGLRLYSYRQKEFDEPLDGIVYSLMIGMGFATVENIKYAIEYQEMYGAGLKIAMDRLYTAVPAHASFAIVMGYFIGKAKMDPKNSFGLMLIGLFAAVFMHGTYDFLIFIDHYSYVGEQVGKGLLTGGAVLSMALSLILCHKLLKQHRKSSALMFPPKKSDPHV